MKCDAKKCAICGKQITGKVRTAVPVKREGWACEGCYETVIKIRMTNLISAVLTGTLPYED